MSSENLIRTPVRVSGISIEPNEQGGYFAYATVKEPGEKPGVITALGETRKETIEELFISLLDFQDAFRRM